MEINNHFYRSLSGIGVELSGIKPDRQCDIERTILQTSSLVDSGDRRILGLILSWIKVHGSIVCVGKLKRIHEIESIGDPQVLSAFAFYAISEGHHEWRTLSKEFPQKSLWRETNEFMLKKSGEFAPFKKAGLVIPNNFIRIREQDILTREQLCNKHLQVRLRTIFGSNLRADAIFYLSKGVNTATTLMKAIGCSYEPAHRIMSDLKTAGSLKLPSLKF